MQIPPKPLNIAKLRSFSPNDIIYNLCLYSALPLHNNPRYLTYPPSFALPSTAPFRIHGLYFKFPTLLHIIQINNINSTHTRIYDMYANISMPHVNYISAIYGSLNCMAGSKYLSGIITLSHFTLYLRICPHETSKKLIAVYIKFDYAGTQYKTNSH